MNAFGLGENDVLFRVLRGVICLGACAGLIGCFAVLRRRSLLGDALGHATLPGICIAFLAFGEKSFWVLLLGATMSGLASVLAVSFLRNHTRLKEDAIIAVVLSTFFGLGIVLMTVIQRLKSGGQAGLNTFLLGQTASLNEEDITWITYLTAGTVVVVIAFYKEFKLVSFDPGFATVQGWPTVFLDFFLLVLMVLAVVVGLPAVGVVLIAALLIIPPATARLWTDRLPRMLTLSAILGAGAGLVGTVLSNSYEHLPAGPCIILAASAFFFFTLLVAPRRGLMARAYAALYAGKLIPPPEFEEPVR